MAKRKAVKTHEQEKENSILAQQPELVRQENLDAEIAEESGDIEGGRTISQAILGLGQTYGNRYVRSLIGDRGKVDKQTQGRIEAQRGSGRPLDEGLRMEMEQSYNRGLGEVRIHTGNEAARLANELDAGAFTTGKDIFFADNAYQPGTEQGMKMLRHELAHVAQPVEDLATLPSVLTQPGDEAEIDAVAAENSDSWAPASALPAGAIARINPPTSTPEAPRASSEPSSSSAPSAPSAAQGAPNADAARTQGYRNLWTATVVTPINDAARLMANPMDGTNANLIISKLDSSIGAAVSILPAYSERPEITAAIQRDCNLLVIVKTSLAPYAGIEVTMGPLNSNLALASSRLSATGENL